MRQMRNIQQHFSIRKLTIGAASVLIGLSLLGFGTPTVHADANDTTVQATSEKVDASTSETKNDVKILWRRKWHPTPVLLPGKSHGWRSLVGYSPWGRKESDTTERLHFHFYIYAKSLQLCLTPCNPVDCSPPGSSVHGILQARVLEWGAISFSRGSSQPRVSHIPGICFNL